MHHVVHDVGSAGHVTHIFEQAEDGEKYNHDGQESKNGADPAEYAIDNQALYPEGSARQRQTANWESPPTTRVSSQTCTGEPMVKRQPEYQA